MPERRNVLVVSLAVGLLSCSVVLKNEPDQCTTNADCAAKGGAFASAICTDGACAAKPVDTGPLAGTTFSCINPAITPSPVNFSGKLYFYDVVSTIAGKGKNTVNGFTYVPVPDSTLDVCLTADLDCTTPKESLKSDAAGAIDITFGSTNPNYLKLTDPLWMPTLYFAPVGFRSTDKTILVGRTSPQTLQGFAKAANVDISSSIGPDATTGLVIVNAYTCDRKLAAGTAWELDDMTGVDRVYVEAGLVSKSAVATDATGIVQFLNAKPRNTRIRGSFNGVEVEARNVIVKPGMLTLVHFWPP